MQRNARMGFESVQALCCAPTSINAKATQRIVLYHIVNQHEVTM
jgi:hypothetical protein